MKKIRYNLEYAAVKTVLVIINLLPYRIDAIFALGYTLIFSVLRIINFTHGAIFTIGAYATYALTGSGSSKRPHSSTP